MDAQEDLACAQRFWPVLFVPDPARLARSSVRLFATAPGLLRFLDGSAGFCSSWPDGLSDRRKGLVTALIDGLRAWIDTFGDEDNSVQARRDIAETVAERMKDLTEGGLTVAARERFVLLTGGRDWEPLPWRMIDVEVLRTWPDPDDLRAVPAFGWGDDGAGRHPGL